MKLELDLSPGDWDDYAKASIADLKRVGVLIPVEPVGIRAFVRLATVAGGEPVVVVTPWLIWKAATEALARHFGEAPPEAGAVPEPAPALPGVLGDVASAIAEHERRWGLGPDHDDGTSHGWQQDADDTRREATDLAVEGAVTWGHVLLEATYAAMAIEDPAELRKALGRVAGTAAAWMTAIDGRTDV